MKTVPLHGAKARGRVALVDDRDYELVMAYTWCVWEVPPSPGRGASGPYAVAATADGRNRQIRMHALLTGWPKVDHKNGNGLDNQRSNLRPADDTQNAQNRPHRIGAASPYKGVRLTGKRWYARITERGKRRVIGSFPTAETAARAYDDAARVAFGEYARLNFPDR